MPELQFIMHSHHLTDYCNKYYLIICVPYMKNVVDVNSNISTH